MGTSPPEQDLLTPVQYLKGVGPTRAEILAKLGVKTARDVLFFFPRDYHDLTELRRLQDFEEGPVLRFVGTVEEIDLRDTGTGRSIVGVLVRQQYDYLRAVWFNQPFVAKQFQRGQRILLTGTARLRGFRWEMHHPRVEKLDGDEVPGGGLQPIYRLTEGIAQYQMRELVRETVERFKDQVADVFDPTLRDRLGLLAISAALEQIHRPDDHEKLRQARHRFVYQELFTMQLALGLQRSAAGKVRGVALPSSARIDARIQRLLPFELTSGQRQVIREIAEDLARPQPMNRLLQGDVGSGKTAVAAYAMLIAIANGYQSVLMAPTEILAEQHFVTLTQLLTNSHVRIAKLTGSLTATQRRDCLQEIADGNVNLVVGTQAVVQEGIKFARLGLAVVDEQHKFGVKQRARLRQTTVDPHYLVMTATPIPRTITMTLYGDLDVSSLRDKPPGSQPVHTYVGMEQKRPQWWKFVRKKLREGRQAYVIAPLVDDKQQGLVSSVEQLFEKLVSEEFEAFRVDLVHGQMPAEEKWAAMEKFRQGATQVLVATSLVEVGVDVPNASVMTIENAERFGLAQLHQLRGRVGRGQYPGFVSVFSPSDSPDARQRLEALASTTDGFELAEIDFRMRGPGDLFGTRQHGLPPLRVADLRSDTETLEQARRDAKVLLAEDPGLSSPAFSPLRDRILLRYGPSLQLGDVG